MISRSCSTRRSLTCDRERHLADLVEEERAAVGRLRTGPRLSLIGAGERALHVAEQLALEQVVAGSRRS